MRLSIHQQILLRPTSPFAFDPTFHKPDNFATGDCEGKLLGFKFVNEGDTSQPSITLHVYSGAKLSQEFLGSLHLGRPVVETEK